jgi:hypothetical protein
MYGSRPLLLRSAPRTCRAQIISVHGHNKRTHVRARSHTHTHTHSYTHILFYIYFFYYFCLFFLNEVSVHCLAFLLPPFHTFYVEVFFFTPKAICSLLFFTSIITPLFVTRLYFSLWYLSPVEFRNVKFPMLYDSLLR